MSTSEALFHLKRHQQSAWPFVYFKTSDDENESAVYQPRDPWSACFCPRCNRKLPVLVHGVTVLRVIEGGE